MKIKKYAAPLMELLRGFISYLPGFDHPIFTRTGGTNSAKYCYGVWLRHLVLAHDSQALSEIPKIVAELGPGDSLGMGLCALLSGAKKYYAFDVVEYANKEKNLKIFEELVELFKKKASIPDDKEFPRVKPALNTYAFPKNILTEDLLKDSLDEKRLSQISDSIKNSTCADSMIVYQVPWNDSSVIKENSVDMIFSQATLEHVDDVENTYIIMNRWLKKDGIMTHQIDLKCHGTSHHWNGHWTYSNFWWKIIRGKRQWLLNRFPCSQHLELVANNNFEIASVKKINSPSKISRRMINNKFKKISDEDLETSGVFFIAKKII
jgi:SAM-dependent methyltransferase